jgi:hypothetical protein
VKPFPVALAATLHDPNAALLRDVVRGLPKLQALYAGVAVSTSPPTSPRIVEALKAAGVFAGSPPTNTRGPLYRLAIREALRAPATSVHYLDFDRALHWLRVAPRECRAVVRVSCRHPVLIVGRTDRAHSDASSSAVGDRAGREPAHGRRPRRARPVRSPGAVVRAVA